MSCYEGGCRAMRAVRWSAMCCLLTVNDLTQLNRVSLNRNVSFRRRDCSLALGAVTFSPKKMLPHAD